MNGKLGILKRKTKNYSYTESFLKLAYASVVLHKRKRSRLQN
uniref:Uncharacterized protein n=1 Tax=Rhizophora mucronata TaxID=61149 RepID=A0A2P2Q1N3_RHIMU